MSSITTQQTKLDLELVPKENRLDIGKCNGRIPLGLTPREPTFQVVLDAIALTPCYPAFLITADVPKICPNSTGFINPGELLLLLSTEVYLERLVVLTSFVSLELKSFRVLYLPRLLGNSRNLNRSLRRTVTSPCNENRSQKANKLRDLSRNLQLSQQQVSSSERLISSDERRKKSLRDFHKTHPSGSGTVTEKPQSVDKITPTVTSKGTGDKLGVPDVTEDDSTESEYESWGNDEDDSNNEKESKQEVESEDDDQEEEFVHTPTDDKDDDNLESESDDVIKSDEEKGMDDTTYQFDDDVDARLKEPTQTDKEVVQGEGVDAEMNDAQQGNENLETTQEQVVEDAHVTISTVMKKSEVPVTSSSRSSDLVFKFLDFSDIPHVDAEIVSPLDHEVPNTEAPTLLTVPVSVIPESSPVFTNIPQSSHTFTPTPIQTTPTPPPTIETTNPLSNLPDFASVFRFKDRISALVKEVAELKKDPLHTQVTSLVDSHLDTRLGETREEFMNFLSESLTTRIKEQVKDQLPQILPKEVSNFAPPVIKKLIKESRDEVTLAKVSSQPHSTYEAASTLTEFELKKILIDKMQKSESYLAAPEHQDCYDSLKKSYDIDKDFFFSYDVYSLKRDRKDKDKDEDPSAGSDRGLKKRKLSKDAEPTTEPKKKVSTSGSSKGTNSQPKSSGKFVQSEEPVFEVADSDMPHDQEGNLGDNEDEPRNKTTSRRDWFKKPTPPQGPTDPDWNVGKTTQEDFSGYILNGLKIMNLTQEVLLGHAFRLLKGTRSSYTKLEYDFEECYKALSEKLDWENPKGGEYPFDLSKPLPLIESGKRQRLPFEFFINNDLKYLQGGISTMTYTTSTTKTKATQYDLPGIEDMVPNIWSPVKVAYDKYSLWGILHWREQRKSFYAFARVDGARWKEKSYFLIKGTSTSAKGMRGDEGLEKFSWAVDSTDQIDSDCYVEQSDFVILCSYLKDVLERFDTSAENLVKEILLKLNLPDHRSILTDSKEYVKMVMEVPDSS
ncbi:hypothetical protein Tco_0419033 [Tanacetum coccineum]